MAKVADKSTAVYICYGEDSEIIYVGISKNLGKRVDQHDADQEWWYEVRRMDVEHYSSREGAAARESLLVYAYQPRYNVQLKRSLTTPGRPVRTTGRRKLRDTTSLGRAVPEQVDDTPGRSRP